jgi:hypothetical protein
MTEYPRGFSRDLLYALSLIGGRGDEAAVLSAAARLRGAVPEAARVILHRLRRRKLIFRRHAERGPFLHLTPRGRSRVSLPAPRHEPPSAPEGLLYFVTYDIPVGQDAIAKEYRALLKRNGWQRLHRSVWFSDRDIRDTAQFGAEELGIEPCVFIGTGTFLGTIAPRVPPGLAGGHRTALRSVVGKTGCDLRSAFRIWVETTEQLRQPTGLAVLDAELREAWGDARRALQGAVRG